MAAGLDASEFRLLSSQGEFFVLTSPLIERAGSAESQYTLAQRAQFPDLPFVNRGLKAEIKLLERL
jgi:hypothetical protein